MQAGVADAPPRGGHAKVIREGYRRLNLKVIGLAMVVGIVAGMGAVVFRGLIGIFHDLLFLGQLSFFYNANVHTPTRPYLWIILIPVIGSVAVTFLVKKFAPEAKGHGVPEVMDAVCYNKGVIRPIVAAVKSLASAITIGSGGSVGREGPIIQIGSSFGSTLGQIINLQEWQRITLIAAGAGGGIAATFNTPIGGCLFALELITPEISYRTVIPIVLSTTIASFIGRLAFGNYPSFNVPQLKIASGMLHIQTLLVYAAMGLLFGLVATAFIRMLYGYEDIFDKIFRNGYIRHAVGMVIVGIMIYILAVYSRHYYIEGVGYATVYDVLLKNLANPIFLLGLFVMKLVATSLTLGSGGSGGIFSPSLFMGATLGGAYALLVDRFLPLSWHIAAPGAAVAGMAGLVGGATGAVFTAVVMIYEMTRDYHVMLPTLITVAVAYGVRYAVQPESIYTLKLVRRGHHIPKSIHTGVYMLRSAVDVMEPLAADAVQEPNAPLVGRDVDILTVIAQMRNSNAQIIYVVDDGKVIGQITRENLCNTCNIPQNILPNPGISGHIA